MIISLMDLGGGVQMSPLSEDIRHHETHSKLVGQTEPEEIATVELELDAIVVPASRPARNLEDAITLARRAGCWLLILCSRRVAVPALGGSSSNGRSPRRSWSTCRRIFA